MKKIYPFVFAAITSATFAQQTISFESQEGFTTGTIHNQNGWQVTESGDGFIQNQVITDEASSDGTFSFKNAFEPDYTDQFFPIFGAVKTFDEPVDYTDFSISYDIKVSEQMKSDFEFTIYAINEEELFVPVAGVGIENRGYIYVIKNADYGSDYIETEWNTNEWVNIKIEVDSAQVRYFINNQPVYSLDNFTNRNINGFNMLHNNFGADAYYDNIKINGGALRTETINAAKFAIYPNPAEDYIHIQSGTNSKVTGTTIYTATGRLVLHSNEPQINVSELTAGIYFIKVYTADGQSITKKFIKK